MSVGGAGGPVRVARARSGRMGSFLRRGRPRRDAGPVTGEDARAALALALAAAESARAGRPVRIDHAAR